MLSPTKPSARRKTIGVFASQVGRSWGAEFIAGINEAAEEHNVNLIHFIGGKLIPIPTSDKNKSSYGLYDLATPTQLDGLLLTADVAYGGVIVWAYVGIAIKEASTPYVPWVAWATVVLIAVMMLGALTRRRTPLQPLHAG